jgi:hypothetical protein
VTASGSVLAELKALGLRLYVDDFGTGYSSLTYLQRFPVDGVKVDRSFVAGLGVRADADAIVRAVIGLAHGLGLVAVAEGVETQDQLDRLIDLRCDVAQGYHLGRPSAADLVRIGGTPKRDVACHLRVCPLPIRTQGRTQLVHLTVGPRRADPPRADAVDPDLRSEIQRRLLGEHDEPCFRDAVRRRLGARAQARNGADVDHAAAAPAQVRQRRSQNQKRTGEIHGQRRVPCADLDALNRSDGARAGVVDDDVQPLAEVQCVGDRVADLLLGRHIGTDHERPALRQPLRDLTEQLLAPADEHDARPL